MKKPIITLATSILIVLLFTSCKDDCPAPTEPTKYEILTDGVWTGVETLIYVDGSLNTTHDITNTELALLINNKYVHYNTGNIDDSGNWLLSADEQKITLFNGVEHTILSLTENELIFNGLGDSGGNPITIEITYKFTK